MWAIMKSAVYHPYVYIYGKNIYLSAFILTPPVPSTSSTEGRADAPDGPEGGAVLAEGLKGNSTLQVLK